VDVDRDNIGHPRKLVNREIGLCKCGLQPTQTAHGNSFTSKTPKYEQKKYSYTRVRWI